MASTSSNLLTQDFLETFRSRRLLLSAPPFLAAAPPPANGDHDSAVANTTFDANVVMVLSVLLCALICSLGLNSIIKCAFRCSSIVSGTTTDQSRSDTSARLANTGIKKKALKTFPIISYAADDFKLPGLDTDCAICLSEFAAGDCVRVLPKCHHGFHVRCIDKWLTSHSSCPTCRHCLIQTCQKIVGCTAAAAATQPPTSSTPPPVHETIVVRIEPLNREGFIPNYHHN